MKKVKSFPKFEVEVTKVGKGVRRLCRTEYEVVTKVGEILSEATMTVWDSGTVSFHGVMATYRDSDNVGTCD